eukprot:8450150-Heterocapsa_arctica.AAC.1
MRHVTADAARLRHICGRMWDEDYKLDAYFNDCAAAFPEFQLFFVGEMKGDQSSSSGMTNEL